MDRVVLVNYQPNAENSRVDVSLFDGTGDQVAVIANNADWGESVSEGGTRVEFGASFTQLGIAPGQTIRMYLESATGGGANPGIADGTAEVQWSPASILGWPLLLIVLIAGALWLTMTRRHIR